MLLLLPFGGGRVWALASPKGEDVKGLQRTISVAHTRAYTDSLVLTDTAELADLFLTFKFDQEQSMLTVTLQSESMLHVFRRPTKYRKTIGSEWGLLYYRSRLLKPLRLPYKVESAPKARYHLSKDVKRRLAPRKHRRRYEFHKWAEVAGMTPIPQKYNMVNDKIEQSYRIDTSTVSVNFTLHDVMTMANNPRYPKEADGYILDNWKDFSIQYQIAIIRDYCLGMEKDVEAAWKQHEAVSAELAKLLQLCPSGQASTNEVHNTFHTMRNAALAKFPRKEFETKCPDLKDAWTCYNECVDSIIKLTCTVSDEAMRAEVSKDIVKTLSGGKHIDEQSLLLKARQLDELTALWQLKTDRQERLNITQQCDKIIRDAENQTRDRLTSTPEQRKAVDMIQKAIAYYKKTCGR